MWILRVASFSLRHADLFATGKYEFFTFGKKAIRVGRAGRGTRAVGTSAQRKDVHLQVRVVGKRKTSERKVKVTFEIADGQGAHGKMHASKSIFYSARTNGRTRPF